MGQASRGVPDAIFLLYERFMLSEPASPLTRLAFTGMLRLLA
jgi:hypothetical protein